MLLEQKSKSKKYCVRVIAHCACRFRSHELFLIVLYHADCRCASVDKPHWNNPWWTRKDPDSLALNVAAIALLGIIACVYIICLRRQNKWNTAQAEASDKTIPPSQSQHEKPSYLAPLWVYRVLPSFHWRHSPYSCRNHGTKDVDVIHLEIVIESLNVLLLMPNQCSAIHVMQCPAIHDNSMSRYTW